MGLSCKWKSLLSLLRLGRPVLLWKAEFWGHRERKLWSGLQRSGMGAVQQAVRGFMKYSLIESTKSFLCFIKSHTCWFSPLFSLFFFFTSSLVSIRDVLCGLLLCTNLTDKPRFGELQGRLTSLTIHHQNRYLDCRWGRFFLGCFCSFENLFEGLNHYCRLLYTIWIHFRQKRGLKLILRYLHYCFSSHKESDGKKQTSDGYMWPCDLQGRPCSAGWRLGHGLCGGWHAVWAKHDVFWASLLSHHHLQPQHLPGLLVLTRLLPPRGESEFSRCKTKVSG